MHVLGCWQEVPGLGCGAGLRPAPDCSQSWGSSWTWNAAGPGLQLALDSWIAAWMRNPRVLPHAHA